MDAFLGILGPTTLLIDGEHIDTWGTPKERAVLATLAAHVGTVVSPERLMRWAWSSDWPRNPVEVCHMYATRIRRALRRLPTPPILRARGGGYRLEMNPSHIDRQRFRDLVAQGRKHVAAGEPEQAIAIIDKALPLWRGEPLADVTSAAAEAWRARVLQNELMAAHKTVIEQLLEIREYDTAMTRLDDLVNTHQDDVALATLRLTALHRGRQSSNATTYYMTVRKRLRADGDEEGAEHLRHVQDALLTEQQISHTPAPTKVPHQLPHDCKTFVGRQNVLAQLDEVTVHDHFTPSVVIVDGIPGVGKTALVTHWGHRRKHLFPGGELHLDLHGYSDRAKVEHSTMVDDILDALGQPPDPDSPLRLREQQLRSLLTDHKTLVVLDNARDTEHVRELVTLLSTCLVIITSRQWLTTLHRETGAQRITVPPMTPAESAALLSAQIGTRGEIGEESRARLAELCGGLPLLLSLSAEALAGRPPAEIVEFATRLDRRHLVLGFGDRGDGPTSAAARFETSYLALGAAERRLFRVLTLHPGPEFGLAAACACAGRPMAESADSLTKLVGAHLLEESSGVHRYRFHDLIAEYAGHCRDRDEPQAEQAAAVRRMLDHYLASATNACLTIQRTYNPPPPLEPDPAVRPATFADAGHALRFLGHERANLTAAITYAAEHGYHEHAWRLADPVSWHFDRVGRNEDSRTVRESVLPSTRAIGDRFGEASTLSSLGMTLTRLGEPAEARRCLEAALALVRHGPARPHASVLHQLGLVSLQQGDARAALDAFRQNLAIDEESGNQEGVCWAHCRIGHALRMIDQHDDALFHLNRASFLAHDIGETTAEAASLSAIGAIHREHGDQHTAAVFCKRALAIAESVPDRPTITDVCIDLCEINTAVPNSRAAIDFGRRAVRVCEEIRDRARHARALAALGNAQYGAGDLMDAVTAWRQAVGLYAYTGDAAAAARWRDRIEAIPPFHHETVPFTRTEGDLWFSEAVTQPLGRSPGN